MSKTKNCKACKIVQPIENFYRAGKYYQAKCKPCHNAARDLYKRTPRVYIPRPRQPRKPRKPSGFNKLPFETRVAIIKKINEKQGYPKIAADHGILYATLQLWKRNGTIKLTI